MKTKRIVISICAIGILIIITLLTVYQKTSLQSSIINEIRRSNPHWKFESEKCFVEKKNNRLSFIIKGPGITDLTAVKNLNIWYLALIDVSITDLSFLQSSSDLERIGIREAPMLKDISTLKGKSLTSVLFDHVSIVNLSVLEKMPLKVLIIRSANLFSIESIKSLENLKWLDLSGCERLEDISPLENITTLDHISLSKTKVSSIEALKNLKMLKKIDLSDTQVSDLNPLVGIDIQRLDIRNSPAVVKPLPENLKVKVLMK